MLESFSWREVAMDQELEKLMALRKKNKKDLKIHCFINLFTRI